MGRLDDKVVLITGGARGQGAEEGRLFVHEGAAVVLTDVRDEEGEATANRIGDAATFVHHDVTSEDEWNDVVQKVLDQHGRIDALINNAGILRRTGLLDAPLDGYMQVIEVNQVGVFLGMKAAGAAMQETGGSIVNISSVAGLRGRGSIAYNASKWAVRGTTKVAARELGQYACAPSAARRRSDARRRSRSRLRQDSLWHLGGRGDEPGQLALQRTPLRHGPRLPALGGPAFDGLRAAGASQPARAACGEARSEGRRDGRRPHRADPRRARPVGGSLCVKRPR